MQESLRVLQERVETSAKAFVAIETAYAKLLKENRELQDKLIATELKLLDTQTAKSVKQLNQDISLPFLQEIQSLSEQLEMSQSTIASYEAKIAQLEEVTADQQEKIQDMYVQLEMQNVRLKTQGLMIEMHENDKEFYPSPPPSPLRSPFFSAIQATVKEETQYFSFDCTSTTTATTSSNSTKPRQRAKSLNATTSQRNNELLVNAYNEHANTLCQLEKWQQIARFTADQLMNTREELDCQQQVTKSLRWIVESEANNHLLEIAAHRDAIQSLKEKLESQKAKLDMLDELQEAYSNALSKLEILDKAGETSQLLKENQDYVSTLRGIETTIQKHSLALNTKAAKEKTVYAQVAIFCNEITTRLRQLLIESERLKQENNSLATTHDTHLARIKDLKDQVHERDAVLRILQERFSQVHPVSLSKLSTGQVKTLSKSNNLRLKPSNPTLTLKHEPTLWL